MILSGRDENYQEKRRSFIRLDLDNPITALMTKAFNKLIERKKIELKKEKQIRAKMLSYAATSPESYDRLFKWFKVLLEDHVSPEAISQRQMQ